MSRIRTIKPEFWVSEQVLSCSTNARLLFIGLWNFCDDNGVHPASYVRLKAEVFPADACSSDEVKDWVGELITNNLLREYVVEGKSYWIVTGWKSHQRIEKPTYKFPLPQSELKIITNNSNNSTTTRRELSEASTTIPRLVDESSTTDRNGMERKGKDKDICGVKTPPAASEDIQSASNEIQEIFKHWQSVMNHSRAKLDNRRHRKITQALKLGYSVEDLKQAIDGCNKTPYNMGSNDSQQRYDDIELILRDASHIERFIGHAINPPCISSNPDSSTDIMVGVCCE